MEKNINRIKKAPSSPYKDTLKIDTVKELETTCSYLDKAKDSLIRALSAETFDRLDVHGCANSLYRLSLQREGIYAILHAMNKLEDGVKHDIERILHRNSEKEKT